MPISGNFTAVIVLNAQIVDDIEHDCETRKREINTINFFTYPILHTAVYAEYVKRFYQNVDDNKEKDIGEKGTVHSYSLTNLPANCRLPFR